VLVATHVLEEVVELASRVVVLVDGAVVRAGTPGEVAAGMEELGAS
jgi:energy-coupling factor transporter ATP-binding protein EcfA2